MKRRNRFKPYVRHATGREKSSSWRVAGNLAYLVLMGEPHFVMVQRGWPQLAIAAGSTRAEVQNSPLAVGWFGFKEWANQIKLRSQGRESGPERAVARRAYDRRKGSVAQRRKNRRRK